MADDATPLEEVRCERRGAIAVLTLDRPARRNAVGPASLAALARHLREQAAAGARAAVLTGAGDVAFCAGYDITALPDEPDDEWLRGHGPLAEALDAFAALPVVAALNGLAVGAGCELALRCDLRVAHPGVSLRMPPVRLGLIYTPEGLNRLAALAGAGLARDMLLTARAVSADEALAAGLLSRVVPAAAVLDEALALAEAITRGAPLAVAGTRDLLDRLLLGGPRLSEEEDAELLARRRAAWQSPEARAARAAFRRS